MAIKQKLGDLLVKDGLDVKATMEVEKLVGRPIQVQAASALLLRRAIESAYFSIDLRDEGTSEFQVTDVRGGARSVKVSSRTAAAQEEELMELSESDLEPVADDASEEPAPQAAVPRRMLRVRRARSRAPLPPPSPRPNPARRRCAPSGRWPTCSSSTATSPTPS